MNMINFFRKSRSIKNGKFSQSFYQRSYHQWILEDALVKRCFDLFLETIEMDSEIDKYLERTGPIAFIPANGKMACSVRGESDMKFIVVFPDLLQIMRSASPTRAIAVLAHELGHIFHNHHKKSEAKNANDQITSLEAQIEADAFASKLGFAKELQDVLLDIEDTDGTFVETRVRISHLTSFLLSERN